MAAIALPLALALGAFADVVAGVVSRLGTRRGRWWGPLSALRDDAQALRRGGDERPALLEASGALAALLGAGVAAGAAAGIVPGSLALVYLALALAAAGTHLAGWTGATPAGRAAARAARIEGTLAEPAFLAALLAMALRWRVGDLEAIRGTYEVLGPGLALRPAGAAVGVGLAALVMLLATAARGAPAEDPGVARRVRRGARTRRAPAGASLAATAARWSLGGATVLLVAVLVAGVDVAGAGPDLVPLVVAAVSAAAVLGAARAGLGFVPRGRTRFVALGALVALAVAAATLVVVA